MNHGKGNRNTDLENVVHELNMLKKRVKDYEKLFKSTKETIRSLRLYNSNASVYIESLERKVKYGDA